MSVIRRYTFKLYPTPAQDAVLRVQAAMMVDLWNALLQRCEDTYRRERRHPGLKQLSREITELYEACPEWRALSTWSGRRVLKSLLKAFDAFFRRAKAGAGRQSGYPRYRARRLADAIPHRCASGCKLLPVKSERFRADGKPAPARNWRLALKGVAGAIRARGEFPAAVLDAKDADVMWRDGAWWLSICVEMKPRRKAGDAALSVRFDLIDEFARVERVDGRRTAADGIARDPAGNHCGSNDLEGGPDNAGSAGDGLRARRHRQGDRGRKADNACSAGDNVRAVHAERPSSENGADNAGSAEGDVRAAHEGGRHAAWLPDNVGSAGKLLDRADAIKSERDRRFRRRSVAWRKYTRRAGRLQARAARIRREGLHEWTTAIVREAGDLTVISPAVKEETASPRGDAREWGAAVDTVSGLNRHVLNQAPAMARAMLAYKAAEAGIRCDLVTDDAPAIAIGEKLVAAGKAVRKTKRAIRRS